LPLDIISVAHNKGQPSGTETKGDRFVKFIISAIGLAEK